MNVNTMVLTCTEGRGALTHVLTNVFLNAGVDHPLALALGKCSYHDSHDIIGMSHENISMALTYEDDQGRKIDLPELQKFQIG
jgi:hypothetical protein